MNIREMASRVLNVKFDFEIKETQFDGVYVKYKDGKAEIGSSTPSSLARGYMLLGKGISEGKKEFETEEKMKISECGVMLDMSRGRVMKVEGVKRYLEYMALHGLNMFMLYTEHTYEVEGYPYMGYQSGRYTLSELQEIDDYAYELGIEVIPCIQTLAHLEELLKFGETRGMGDNQRILMPCDPETMKFIEACISTVRKAFRSNRIHIGCDEAAGLGQGKYLNKYGPRDKFELFNDHLGQVVEICKKYNYHPMMWSDMYFSFAAPNKKEGYDTAIEVPQYAIDTMPDADMVFWDYYHDDNDFYRINIEKHKKFNRKIMFAGGIWTWNGFITDYRWTYESVKPAMEECLKGEIDSVLATSWSNAGCEISHMQAIQCLSVYSEYVWRGLDCTKEDVIGISEFVTKTAHELTEALSDLYCRMPTRYRIGQMLIWSDPLINLLCYDIEYDKAEEFYSSSLKVIEKYPDVTDIDYYESVFKVALGKARLHKNLQKKYKEGNKEWLHKFATEDIPALIGEYNKLYKIHDKVWHRDYKTHGFEVQAIRYAGAAERVRYTGEMIMKYINGEISEIEALEAELIKGKKEIAVPIRRVMQTIMS